MPAKAECGTYAAYMRHKRKKETVDEPCAQAARDQKNSRMAAKRAAAAEEARAAVPSVPERGSQLEVLEEIQRYLRAQMLESPPQSVAAIARELRMVSADIASLNGDTEGASQGSVGGIDDLTRRREERQARRASASADRSVSGD